MDVLRGEREAYMSYSIHGTIGGNQVGREQVPDYKTAVVRARKLGHALMTLATIRYDVNMDDMELVKVDKFRLGILLKERPIRGALLAAVTINLDLS